MPGPCRPCILVVDDPDARCCQFCLKSAVHTLRLGFHCMALDLAFVYCFFCGRRFSPSLEAKEGKVIQAWKVGVCLRCEAGNPEGLPESHPAVRILAERGLALKASTGGIVRWPRNESAEN